MAEILQKHLRGTAQGDVEADLEIGEIGWNEDAAELELIIEDIAGGTFYHFPSLERLDDISAGNSGVSLLGVTDTGGAWSVLTGDTNLQTTLDDLDTYLAALPALADVLLKDGSVALTGNWSMGSVDFDMDGGLDITTDDGINYSPGSDIDIDVATLEVTGTPKLWWDESDDSWEFSKPLRVIDTLDVDTITSDEAVELLITTVDNDGDIRLFVNTTGDIVFESVCGKIIGKNVLYFTGENTGLPRGSVYGNDIAWSQAAAAQNTWYNIADSDMANGSGGLVLTSHDGNGKITVDLAGRYLISYSLSFSVDAADDHIETGIEISGSGSAVNDGRSHTISKFANEEEGLSAPLILDLAASATIEACIRTVDAGTPTIAVQHLNIIVIHMGGT